MFSESFDIKKGDILRSLDGDDSMDTMDGIDTKESDKKASKDRLPKSKELKNYIKNKTDWYTSFFRTFPNGFHEDVSKRSIWRDFHESMASAIWDIPEKKIKWFDKTFPDGKKVEVREENWEINMKFLNNNESTTITLTNFMNIWNIWDNADNTDNAVNPIISIVWNKENLPDSIRNSVNKIDWTITLSDGNTEIFKEIFDSLDQNIIKSKMEEYHGYANNIKQKAENLFLEISAKNTERVEDNTSLRWDSFIDCLLQDSITYYNTFTKENFNNLTTDDYCALIASKLALWFAVLLRNSSKSEIKRNVENTLWYNDDGWVEQKNTTNKSEESIEFIPVDEFFVENRDVLVKLAIDACQSDETLRDKENIINFLTL